MMNKKYLVLISLLITIVSIPSCTTASNSRVENQQEKVTQKQYPTQKILTDGLECEFMFMGYDASEKSMKFKSKVKNVAKNNKMFYLNSVYLLMRNQNNSSAEKGLKIPARDVALVNKQLYEQITTLESNHTKNAESLGMLVNNLTSEKERKAQKKKEEDELQSMKERLEALKQKSFYSTQLSPGEVVGGFVYFPIEDEAALKNLDTRLVIQVKNVVSNEISY